jgi:uncharacterized DUF497 family protein
MFSWDEGKRSRNLQRHGIDFADAAKVFDGFTVTAEDRRYEYGEQRFLTLGWLNGEIVSVAHAERGEEVRIISMRKATNHEAKHYYSQIPD